MGDMLLQIGGQPQLQKLAKRLGVPLPPTLRRGRGPWPERPLEDQRIVVGGAGELHGALAETLAPAGASVLLSDGAPLEGYAEVGEAHARPVARLGGDPGTVEALVFDASGLAAPSELRALHGFFQPRLRCLARSGRVVVLGRPPESAASPSAAAAARALDGFARSVAKELGRRGSTAHLLVVERGAEDRVAGPLRFLLSDRSAYVSGQPVRVSATARPPAESGWVRPLHGKVALVTGAARGIGAAIATTLGREGAHVVCVDRPEEDEPLARVARRVGGSMLAQDIAADGAAGAIAGHLADAHGRVDVVVHNAGVTRDKTLANMDAERWDQALAVNLGAVVAITGRLLEGPLADEGRIVCLSSIAGIAGNFGQANYAASKAGLIGYVQRLAPEVGARGITANAVAPGFIETSMTARIPFFTREVGRRLANLSQAGLPSDVGEAVAFLASPSASGLSGAVLRVCGGSLLGA